MLKTGEAHPGSSAQDEALIGDGRGSLSHSFAFQVSQLGAGSKGAVEGAQQISPVCKAAAESPATSVTPGYGPAPPAAAGHSPHSMHDLGDWVVVTGMPGW